ncbi:hypothetical protein BOTBODRAFT_189475 [Botryobasidium botryosum FD-172 SS1]|uniref:CFEM domain-containing protein n=1 Tax=Botryobasidium botryosum (strain FD-172 SS1) TaxID=930990 RepID=A0A067M871_BOTB1|nr:hypothetical protein BOTBODRAFT_189475 [Botryobasidium botryosum FD-172 SS1]
MRTTLALSPLLAISAFAFALNIRMTPTTTTAAPVSTVGIPHCILKCAEVAAKSTGCSDITNAPCVCNSMPFLNSSEVCIVSKCPELHGQAHAILGTICAGVPTTLDLSFTTETVFPAPTGV